MRIQFAILLLTILGANGLFGQGSANRLREEAERNFREGNYYAAVEQYEQLVSISGTTKDIQKKLGISYFQTNRLDEAGDQLKLFFANDKSDLDVIYGLGQISHHLNKFEQAIEFYKYFLSKAKTSNFYYQAAITNVKRADKGIRIRHKDELAIIENAGKFVNTQGDEMAAMWSPNHQQRIYFTSNQAVDTSDDFSGRVAVTDDYNMFGSSINRGVWDHAYPLNLSLNTNQVEFLYGFNSTGRVLYFGRGEQLDYLNLFREDLNVGVDESTRVQIVDAPFARDPNMIDLQLVTDSVVLFATILPGGYGGYDLYYAQFKNGQWSDPVNLGPEINSEWDERSPFLANDGRTLYFSSNNVEGIGGYDIFIANYRDREMNWSNPENLGLPFNSAGNDLHFVLGRDGQTALFTSDRKESIGGFDIYTGFFKSMRTEQSITSLPELFFDVPDFKLNSKEYQDEVLAAKMTNLEIEPLYYTSDNNVLQPRNKTEVDKLIEIGKRFPTTGFTFLVNSESAVSPEVELYFGIKRAENIGNYMISKGIDGHRITLQSVGSLYPIAKNEVEGRPNISGQNLNKRIEAVLNNIDSLPIKVTYKQPYVSDLLKTNDGNNFKRRIAGLSYRVQIVSLRQMFKGDIYSLNSDMLIESIGGSGAYRYLLGLFPTYKSASDFRAILANRGYADAYIVPYIDNQRYQKGQINEVLMNKYPDLRQYILN